MLWGRALTLLFVAVAAGCPAPDTFQCVSDAQCGDGMCEANEYCSFPDAMCDSGRRYGNEAATGIAGQCVPVDVGSTTEAGSTTVVGPSTSAPGGSTTTLTSSVGSSTGASFTSSSTGADGESTTTAPGTSSSTGLGSTTSGAESSSTGTPELCDTAETCGGCFDCVVEPGTSCASAQLECETFVGCPTIAQCLRGCAIDGICFGDCCQGETEDAATAALELLECQQDACTVGTVCLSFASPLCN